MQEGALTSFLLILFYAHRSFTKINVTLRHA